MPGSIDHDVVRLEVAMHDPSAVRRRQGPGGLNEHRDDLRSGARLVGEPLRQRRAFDLGHREVHAVVVQPGIEHRHDMGVVQRSKRSAFAKQPAPLRITGVCPHQLEGDQPLELRVPGSVHHTHCAAAEHTPHLVPTDHQGRGARQQPRLDQRQRTLTPRWLRHQRRPGECIRDRVHHILLPKAESESR